MFCCFCHSSIKSLLWNIAFLYRFAATKFCYVQFLIWCFNKTNNVPWYLCNTSWSKLLIQNNTVKTTVKTTQTKQHSQHSQNNTVKTTQHYRPSTPIAHSYVWAMGYLKWLLRYQITGSGSYIANFLHFAIFWELPKILVTYWIPHSYFAGVTAA